MLAKKFDPARITYPCYIQRKLDGVRALSIPGQPTLQSRPKPPDFKLIYWNQDVLPTIHSELAILRHAFPSLVFDGELYNHRLSLQQINSRVAVKRTTPHKEVSSIFFVIFDVFDTANPYLSTASRVELMDALIAFLFNNPASSIRVMPQVYCPSEQFADTQYKLALTTGYEGLIYRKIHVPYTSHLTCNNKENRTYDMLKRKESLDIECTIVDSLPGEGKHEGRLGSFIVRDRAGRTFQVGNGLSDAERETFWSSRDSLIDGKVRITFRCYSDTHLPLEPRIASIDF